MPQLDRLVGFSMLVAATTVFLYYTTWTLFMVRYLTIPKAAIFLGSKVRLMC
jgi:hypothetical protein